MQPLLSRIRTAAVAAVVLAASVLSLSPAQAAPDQTPAPLDRAAVEAIIHDYIVNNPDVILTAVDQYQRQSMESKQSAALDSNRADLYEDAASPMIGNPKGDVTLIEFFDYNCGYCKRVAPMIEQLSKDDKNVKIIFKEFPILAPTSETAAKWALAAAKQGKYFAYHQALMAHQGQISEDLLTKIGADLKLDVAKLRTDAAATEPLLQIERNRALASQMGLTGTPSFIVGDQIVPGAIEMDAMKDLIAKARAASKKDGGK
jgi:protein-disulfide isomerase